MIGSGRYPISQMCGLTVGLAEIDRALGASAHERASSIVHAAVVPVPTADQAAP
jgi:hypothetical protein